MFKGGLSSATPCLRGQPRLAPSSRLVMVVLVLVLVLVVLVMLLVVLMLMLVLVLVLVMSAYQGGHVKFQKTFVSAETVFFFNFVSSILFCFS